MLIDSANPLSKRIIVVDPQTGKEIRHVVWVETQSQTIGVKTVVPAHPLVPMVFAHADGSSETLPYTFVEFHDMGSSRRQHLSTSWHVSVDIVDKHTGEVLYEFQGMALPLRLSDPAAYCQAMDIGDLKGRPLDLAAGDNPNPDLPTLEGEKY